MKLHIKSDGTREGTQVLDAKTGEPVDGVRAVSFRIDALEIPTAIIEIVCFSADVVTDFDVNFPNIKPETTKTQLPTVSQMRGAFPDLTGEESTADYIRRIRG